MPVRHRRQLAIWITAVAGLFVMAIGSAPPVHSAANDLLPDLRMAQPYNVQVEQTSTGGYRLRFGTIVWNVGDGPLDVRASGREGQIMRDLRQVIHTRDGRERENVPPDAFAFYAGDGHNHWHVSRFVVVTLFAKFDAPVDDEHGPTFTQRSLRKIGFCLTDLVRVPASLRSANSVGRARYPVTGCGDRSSSSLRMGISVGYGDDYKPFFNRQAVNITGLPSGTYRLCATTNSNGMWLEKDGPTANNSAWVDLDLDSERHAVQVVASGDGDCERPPPTLFGVGA